MRHVALITVIVAVSGCAAVHHFSDTTERENAAANFRARWVGKSEADVIRRYGSPADAASAPSGHRILTYRPRGASCDLQFEIDDVSSVVVRTALTGNDCRGDL